MKHLTHTVAIEKKTRAWLWSKVTSVNVCLFFDKQTTEENNEAQLMWLSEQQQHFQKYFLVCFYLYVYLFTILNPSFVFSFRGNVKIKMCQGFMLIVILAVLTAVVILAPAAVWLCKCQHEIKQKPIRRLAWYLRRRLRYVGGLSCHTIQTDVMSSTKSDIIWSFSLLHRCRIGLILK